MSEENVPKLRLKPKLAADPVNAPQPPAVVPPVSAPTPPTVVDEQKTVRLKPKLAAFSPPNSAPLAPSEPVSKPVELSPTKGIFPPPVSPFPAPGSALEADKSGPRFSLKPKASTGAVPPEFPPPLPPAVVEESASQSPIPAPDYVDPEAPGRPSEVVVRSLTARPFPPPPANFPPPPATAARPAPPWAQLGGAGSAVPQKKNFALLAGGVIVVLAVLGGVFFAYKKFTAAPSAPPAPKIVAKPQNREAAPTPLEAKPEPVVPGSGATVTDTLPTQPKAVVVPEPEPVEVAPPPPPPSAAFKAWVDALRVGGVRAGATTRVFIGGTAYATGELVNPQLGIIFDSYNAETRHLVFKDKTGAIVERRN